MKLALRFKTPYLQYVDSIIYPIDGRVSNRTSVAQESTGYTITVLTLVSNFLYKDFLLFTTESGQRLSFLKDGIDIDYKLSDLYPPPATPKVHVGTICKTYVTNVEVILNGRGRWEDYNFTTTYFAGPHNPPSTPAINHHKGVLSALAGH